MNHPWQITIAVQILVDQKHTSNYAKAKRSNGNRAGKSNTDTVG